MRVWLVLNDPPYVRVFLMGDAVACAVANQKVPAGYYNLEHMIDSAAGEVLGWAAAAPVWIPGGSRTVASLTERAGLR